MAASGTDAPRSWRRSSPSGFGWSLAGAGLVSLAVAVVLRPAEARSAASQVWPPFVLVAGLILVGLVADDDGLFAAAGDRLARTARSGTAIFGGASVMIGVVTALLNLDTPGADEGADVR